MWSLETPVVYSIDTSFADSPGKLSMSVYFPGCQLSCPFCHNKHILNDTPAMSLNRVSQLYSEFSSMFADRGNIGITLTGGEPGLYKDLIDTWVRSDELIANTPMTLHTNGLDPLAGEVIIYLDSVVLSVKNLYIIRKVFLTETEYFNKLSTAMERYDHCESKSISLVNSSWADTDELQDMANTLVSFYPEWKIKWVDDINET